MVQDLIEQLQTLYHVVLTNPWSVLFAVAVVVPIYGLRVWLLRRTLRANRLAGWAVAASAGQTRHETGIGTRDALILAPPRKFTGIGVFVIVVFLWRAWPVWTGPAPIWPPDHLTDAALLVAYVGFPVLGLFLIRIGFTRVVLVGTEIQLNRLFRKPVIYLLSDLQRLKPAGSTIENGVWMEFSDHRRLRVMAFMSGYGDLIQRLSEANPKAAQMIGRHMQSKGQSDARTSRS